MNPKALSAVVFITQLIVLLSITGCTSTPLLIANKVTEAHGGLDAYQALSTFYVKREHDFIESKNSFRFDIFVEYETERILQSWQRPPGNVAWDGERAWSVNWPLHQSLEPRFVTSIGFYLVNLPWLIQHPDTKIKDSNKIFLDKTSLSGDFIMLRVEMEAAPVRKPIWYEGPRDEFALYIDPESYQVRGVLQNRTYAGRPFVELFVPETWVIREGLLLPERYRVYSVESDEVIADGIFSDYQFNLPSPREFSPTPNALFDSSSSLVPR